MASAFLRALILVAAVVLVYRVTEPAPLVFDDVAAVRLNPSLRTWPDLGATLAPEPRPVGFSRRPVVNLTMALDYARAGGEFRSYRVTSYLLHAAAAVLLGALTATVLKHGRGLPDALRQRAAGVGFWGALLWALHPLSTGAVNYLTQRSEVLMALFAFAMLAALAKALAAREAGRSAWGWLLVAWSCGLLGMGSKESMLGLPLVAAVFDRAFFAGSWREVARRWWIYAVLLATAGWPLARMVVESSDLRTQTTAWAEVLPPYLRMQAWGFGRMLRLALWPDPLVFFYGTHLRFESLGQVWWPVLLAGGVLVMTLIGVVRGRWWGFLLAGVVVPLLPSSSFFPVLGQPVAEHRFYFPLALLVTSGVAGLFLVTARWPRGWAAGLCAVVAMLAGFGTFQRNRVYLDDVGLWLDNLHKLPPGEARRETLQSLAALLTARNDYAGSLLFVTQALEIRPDDPKLKLNAAGALLGLGRVAEAEEHLRQILQQHPGAAEVKEALAGVVASRGDLAEAAGLYREVLEVVPARAESRTRLAAILAARGDPRQAEQELLVATESDPYSFEAQVELATLRTALQRPEEARQGLAHWSAGLAAKEPDTVKRAAIELQKRGLPGCAAACLDPLLLARPQDPGARMHLAWLLATAPEASERDGPRAAQLASEALRMFGDRPPPVLLETAAAAAAENGDFPSAERLLRQALQGAGGSEVLANRLQSRLEAVLRGERVRERIP